MPRVSTKDNKTVYQQIREEKELTREKASELLEFISPERLERIESRKFNAQPDEILAMAEKYQAPELCNYYCANECAIGQRYVPEVKVKDLSGIILELLASLNSMQKRQERMIEITSDGNIQDEELADFISIQKELEKISVAVETLQLWVERKLADGSINPDEYNSMKEKSN